MNKYTIIIVTIMFFFQIPIKAIAFTEYVANSSANNNNMIEFKLKNKFPISRLEFYRLNSNLHSLKTLCQKNINITKRSLSFP